MFKHALTHEVAYNSLLVQRRKELHRLIGIGDRGALRGSAGRAVRGPRLSLLKSGGMGQGARLSPERRRRRRRRPSPTREALALYDQALEAVGHLGDAVDAKTLMAIHQAKADLYLVLSDLRVPVQKASACSGSRVGLEIDGSEAVALAGMGVASAWGHQFDRALTEAYQAIVIAREIDVKPVLAGGYFITRPCPCSHGPPRRSARRKWNWRSPSAGRGAMLSTSRSPTRLRLPDNSRTGEESTPRRCPCKPRSADRPGAQPCWCRSCSASGLPGWR